MCNRIFISFITFTLFTFSCGQKQDMQNIVSEEKIKLDSTEVKMPLKSNQLIERLNELISFEDSLSKTSSTHSTPTSIWIYFYQKEKNCYVTTISNFEYYNSEDMDGFFTYRDKFITVYNSDSTCGLDFIDQSLLSKSKIPELIDYNDPDMSLMPHEPYSREYKIISMDSLVITFDGYR